MDALRLVEIGGELLVLVGGGVGLAYWIKRHFDAMRETIETQGKAIDAQAKQIEAAKTVNDMMSTAFEKLSPTRFLEHVQSITKITEQNAELLIEQQRREMEAVLGAARTELEKERQRAQRFTDVSFEATTALMNVLASNVPAHQRRQAIETIQGSETLKTVLREYVVMVEQQEAKAFAGLTIPLFGDPPTPPLPPPASPPH